MESPILSERRPKKRRFFIIVFLLLILVTAIGIGFWWWQNRQLKPVLLTQTEKVELEERIYESGEKSFILSEREINGLIHEKTKLGKDIRVELVNDAIHLRVKTTLDEEVPLFGGKTVNLRARLIASEEEGISIDDVTIYGVSLPNAWLGDLKGVNLFEALDEQLPSGIKYFEVVNGEIRIELED